MFGSFKKSIALGALMALALSGQAVAMGWTTAGPVGTITAGGPTWVSITGVTDNPDACTAPNIQYILKPSNPNYGTLYSALLAASASGKNVIFLVDQCINQYGVTYPIIIGVQYSP